MRSRIYHMGAPGRNRLAAKIYDELCIGKKGMKVSDILDGLKVCEWLLQRIPICLHDCTCFVKWGGIFCVYTLTLLLGCVIVIGNIAYSSFAGHPM